MSGYTKERLLSQEEMQEAMELYHSLSNVEYWQYYNLFKVQRCEIPVSARNSGFMKTLHKRARTENQIGSGYFLKYPPGSFTKVHRDYTSDLTMVTLLESKDLVGGCSIVNARWEQNAGRPSHMEAIREENRHFYGESIVPDVIDINDGETLCYGSDLQHGVSKVYEGHRIVLVTWWSNSRS